MLLQVWSVHVWLLPLTSVCVFQASTLLRRVSEARQRIFGKNSLFFSCSLAWTSIHMNQISRAPSGHCAFRRVPSKCEDFLKTGNQSFFGARRFRLKDFSSEEVNPWCWNSILCWKLLLPIITSDTLNSIFQTQPSRMVIKSVGLLHLLGREFGVITVNLLTEICSFDREVWNWLKKKMVRIVNLGCV